MSFECWAESCSEGQAEQSRQEEQQGEIAEEDVEVSCRDDEPAENGGGEWPSSPDHSGLENVTSEGVQEQVQKLEMQRFSHRTVNQKSQGSGVCGQEWDVRCDQSFQHNKKSKRHMTVK